MSKDKKKKQSVTVADVFINIGMKGTDGVARGLTGVKNSIGDVASAGLKATAVVSGVVFALERLMSRSGEIGTALYQFGELTGLSTDKLQKFQYMALQSGESADEMAAALKSVQSVMSAMVLGKGAPEGLGALVNTVGFDPSKARNLEYVFTKLREYARATKDLPDVSNVILKSFGLDDKTITTLRSSAVDLDKISKSRIYSASQIKSLKAVDIGFANIHDKFNHELGNLTAQFGGTFVRDLDHVVTSMLKLTKAIAALNQEFKLTSSLAKVFDFLADVTTKNPPKLQKELAPRVSSGKAPEGWLGQTARDITKVILGAPPVPSGAALAVPPTMHHHATSNTRNMTQNNNVNVEVNGVKTTADTAQILKKTLNDTLRQGYTRGGY